jgi:protein SCO1/2
MFIKIFLTVIFLILNSYAYQLHGSIKGFPKKAPEVKNLITEEGKSFNFKTLKGKVVLMTYGYTQCPHVCPTITAFLKQITSILNEKGYKGKYVVIFVSVDPKFDTPERLKEYKISKHFDDFIFLTGTKKDLKKVWKDYNVYVKDKGVQEGARIIDHSAKVTIIDKNGYVREEFLSMYLPVDDIVQDVEYLIKE